MKTIPEGTVFVMTTGESEEYEIITVFMAIKDINPGVIQKKYLEFFDMGENRYKDYYWEERQVIRYLVQKHYAEEIKFSELHLGSEDRRKDE